MKEFPPGTTIGSYRIVRLAGRGAVGLVYLAEHVVLGKQVALKTLNAAYAGEGVFRERFSREAQGAASVTHPNIVSVLDAGEHENVPYLVMTFVDGPDLEQVLQDSGGRLEPSDAVRILSLIADALDTAGRHGFAHRDVKPANILLEGWPPPRGGTPTAYLTDFGLVKSSAQATITRTGQFVGTLLYMSPEQIQSRAVPASDQYSLACVLWECLTGTLPFEPTGASTLSILSAHLNDPVPAISERPGGRWTAELDGVFARALAKSPDDRWPSCTAFLDAATRALGLGSAAPSPQPSPPASAGSPTRADHTRPDQTRRAPAPPSGTGSRAAPGPPPPLAGARPVSARPQPQSPSPAEPGPYVPPGLPPGLAAQSSTDAPGGEGGGRGLLVAGAVIALLVVAAVVIAVLQSGG